MTKSPGDTERTASPTSSTKNNPHQHSAGRGILSLNAIAFQAFLSILGPGFRFRYWLAWRFDGWGFEGVATLVFGFDNHLHALLCVVLLEVVDACVGEAYAAFAVAARHFVFVASITMIILVCTFMLFISVSPLPFCFACFCWLFHFKFCFYFTIFYNFIQYYISFLCIITNFHL